MGIKITGLDSLNKKIEEMKSPEYLQGIFLDKICSDFPEASAERHKFKFIEAPTGFAVDPTSISPELYSKITKQHP